jgi:hypothetical protein
MDKSARQGRQGSMDIELTQRKVPTMAPEQESVSTSRQVNDLFDSLELTVVLGAAIH